MVVALLLAFGSDSEDSSETAKAPTDFKVGAMDLYSEYQNHEVRADNKYRDKILEVEGVVDDIGKDVLDDIYITLSPGWVRCGFGPSESNNVGDLNLGDRVVIKGKCEGMTIGMVSLHNCVVLGD